MLRIVALLAVIKGVCVALDPDHELFRPISLYQTAEYAYLGTAFIVLVAIASSLALRKLFLRADAEELIGGVVWLLALTLCLYLLVLADIGYGGFHLLVAATALAGYAGYLLYAGRVFGDLPLQSLAGAMLVLCGVPVIAPATFGVVENVLVALHCVAFSYFYYVTLESRRPASRLARRGP